MAATQWQLDFAERLHDLTGLDRLVALGWVYAEDGEPGNPLNIGPGRDYGSWQNAAKATAKLLQTSSNYGPILRAIASGDPWAQVTAIVNSPWDAAHYSGPGEQPGQRLIGAVQRAAGDIGWDFIAPDEGSLLHRIEGAVTEPISNAAASVEQFVLDKSKLGLAYVLLGVGGLALVLIGARSFLYATDPSSAAAAGRALGGPVRAARRATAPRDEIPF